MVTFYFFCDRCFLNIDKEVVREGDDEATIDKKIKRRLSREKMEAMLANKKFQDCLFILILALTILVIVVTIGWGVFSIEALNGVEIAQCALNIEDGRLFKGFVSNEYRTYFAGLEGVETFLGVLGIELTGLSALAENSTVYEILDFEFEEPLGRLSGSVRELGEHFAATSIPSCLQSGFLPLYLNTANTIDSKLNFLEKNDIEYITLRMRKLRKAVTTLRQISQNNQLEGFVEVIKKFQKKVKKIKNEILKLYDQSKVFDVLGNIKSITSVYVWSCIFLIVINLLIYLLSLVLCSPSQSKERSKPPANFKSNVVITIILLVTSVILTFVGFLNTLYGSLFVNYCSFSDNLVSDKNWSDVFVHKELRTVVDICMFSHEKSLNQLLDFEDKHKFKRLEALVDGFSLKISDIALSNSIKAPRNFERLDKQLDHRLHYPLKDFALSAENILQSNVNAVNEALSCTKDVLAIRRDHCPPGYPVSTPQDLTDFRLDDPYCLLLEHFNVQRFNKRYSTHKCAEDALWRLHYITNCLKNQKNLVSQIKSKFRDSTLEQAKTFYESIRQLDAKIQIVQKILPNSTKFLENGVFNFTEAIGCGHLKQSLFKVYGSFCLNFSDNFGSAGLVMILLGPLMSLLSCVAFLRLIPKDLFIKRLIFKEKEMEVYENMTMEEVSVEGMLDELIEEMEDGGNSVGGLRAQTVTTVTGGVKIVNELERLKLKDIMEESVYESLGSESFDDDEEEEDDDAMKRGGGLLDHENSDKRADKENLGSWDDLVRMAGHEERIVELAGEKGAEQPLVGSDVLEGGLEDGEVVNSEGSDMDSLDDEDDGAGVAMIVINENMMNLEDYNEQINEEGEEDEEDSEMG